MCKHADQTEEFIHHLLENVYPCLELKLQNAIHCVYLKEYDEEHKDYLLELMQNLRAKDPVSYITYQQPVTLQIRKVF